MIKKGGIIVVETRYLILIDTHVLIWDALAPERLSGYANQKLTEASQQGSLVIADISLWEIVMLIAKGRVKVGVDCRAFLNLLVQAYALRVQPITPQIAAKSIQLPDSITKDPVNRLIVATALVENIPLITADRNLQASSLIATIW